MPKLELYYKDTCPYCKKVFRVIEKYNLEDKIVTKNILENDEYKDTLVSEGGSIMVPCLFIDGKAMYESSDIIKYLKETFVEG